MPCGPGRATSRLASVCLLACAPAQSPTLSVTGPLVSAGALGSAAAPGLAVLRSHLRNVSGRLRGSHCGEERPLNRLPYPQLAVSRTTSGWLPTTTAQTAALARSAAQVPSIWEPLQLVGATAGAAIAFILPGALALSLTSWRLCSGGGAGGLLLMAVGLLLAVTGIAGTVVR